MACRSLMLLLLLSAAAASGSGSRRVGWWWDAPSTSDDPSVAALLTFAAAHTNIVSSVLMRCGPSTKSGKIEGALSPACSRAIPALAKLGIGSELWLGETDSVAAAGSLLNDPDGAVAALKALGTANPGITGFNFDFEVAGATRCRGPAGGEVACDELYASFLGAVRHAVGGGNGGGDGDAHSSSSSSRYRITADVSCSTTGGWAPIIGNCSRLAPAVDRIMNMGTYNAGSYLTWLSHLTPALASGVPRDKLGAGLGCWVDSKTNNTWSTTSESAELRVCALMNASVPEIDMFRLAPELNWPEPFWVAQLERYMKGGGCELPPVPASQCPAEAGWATSGDGSCCSIHFADVDRNAGGCVGGKQSAEACAKAQCENSKTPINTWKPLNYSSHPYTCCSAIGKGVNADRDTTTPLPTASPAAPLFPSTHRFGLLDVDSPVGALETFYYYVPSTNPDAPLLIWMNGGPGASSLMGLFTELGPQLINLASVPSSNSTSASWTLFDNPSAWSSDAALLVWEQPAGVGFSRCRSGCPTSWNDTSSADANVAFLEAFWTKYPDAATRDIFITGESYGGVYVPLLAARLITKDRPGGPLVGIAVGNGCIGWSVSGGCGLDSLDNFVTVLEDRAPGVSRGVLGGVRTACDDGQLISGKNATELSGTCRGAMRDLIVEVGAYNEYHWGSPCGPYGQGNWGDGRTYTCANGVMDKFFALAETQIAMNVIKPGDAPREWKAYDGDSPFYTITADDVQPQMRALLAANVSVLVYNGLMDTAVPNVGAEKWVPRVAGAGVAEARRKWGARPMVGPMGGAMEGASSTHDTPDLEMAGEVTVYASGLTYVTVEGAGHLVPADRPVAAHTMLTHWMSGEPLPPYTGKTCQRLWLGRGYGDFC